MYYVCVENGNVVSILNYQPALPTSVTVTTITDEQHKLIEGRTHRFDPVSKTVVPAPREELAAIETQKANAEDQEFLRSTDWKVLRHIRQKALNVPTSLTDAEYTALEQQRQAAASRIV